MTTVLSDQNLEKQIQKHMGCMSGFLHIFDRHHSLPGKRFYSPKRLPPSPVSVVDTTSESEISSPTKSETPASTIPAQPLPLPVVFESKEEGNRSTWRSRKEAPRLSLDSRATTDAKGSFHCHGSPSVVARLMGLEPLSPNSSHPGNHPELRRSASESRLSKDLFRSLFVPNGAVSNSPIQSHVPMEEKKADPRNYPVKKGGATEGLVKRGAVNSTSQWRAPPHRKSFFYFGDIFPETKHTVTIYGEIQKRIGTKGKMNEPSQDLEALKQILEALQLKGLLHSKPPPSPKKQIAHRNYVYDENPIVLMKPSRSRASTPINRRVGNDYSPANGRNQLRGVRRSFAGTPPSISPRRERSVQSPTRTGRSPSPTTRTEALAKPKALRVETQRRTNDLPGNRKASPKLSARKTGTDPTVTGRLVRSKKPTTVIHRKENDSNAVVLEDESSSSSSISGSSITTSTDTERSKANLSARSDKLLHSISGISTTDPQPSPVSVLDSSFFKDESSSTPSPVGTQRNIDFKDQSSELEEDTWSPRVSPIQSKHIESSDDSDFLYISDILEAVHCFPEDTDVFLLLENGQYLQQTDTSKVARLDRKLIFDTIDEILDRNKRVLPWKTISSSLSKIWSEFERIREQYSGEDLFESVCSVLRKDMVGDSVTGWGGCPVEMSEAVLDIERLIFKDLICDSIGDLAALASRDTVLSSVVPKRKLVF